mmetsp:Transcript_41213/g.127270  ORF Transcript_41213/g.127270 Transcript_41213/m.127270 type:complete len:207 (+) Transcript_41213:4862-5482(+)
MRDITCCPRWVRKCSSCAAAYMVQCGSGSSSMTGSSSSSLWSSSSATPKILFAQLVSTSRDVLWPASPDASFALSTRHSSVERRSALSYSSVTSASRRWRRTHDQTTSTTMTNRRIANNVKPMTLPTILRRSNRLVGAVSPVTFTSWLVSTAAAVTAPQRSTTALPLTEAFNGRTAQARILRGSSNAIAHTLRVHSVVVGTRRPEQ